MVLFLLICVTSCVGYRNDEKRLRADFANEQRANQADFDNMYKTIAQKYQVKGDFEQTLKAVTHEVVSGRSGGSLATFVTENYPTLDAGVYREMMATVEGKRNQFEYHQTRLSDIKAQHDKLITTWPGSMWISTNPLDIQLVTSARTDAAFSTGKDEDINLKGK